MKKIILTLLIISGMAVFTQQAFSSDLREMKKFTGWVGGVSILVNGERIEPSVEPVIIEEGIALVPLREISEALGFKVEWDEANRRILIDELIKAAPQPVNPWDGKHRENIVNMKILRNVGPFYYKAAGEIKIAGKATGTGIAVNLNSGSTAELVIDLAQRYATAALTYAVDDATMNSSGAYQMTILADEQEIFSSDVVKPAEYPRFISPGQLDLSHVNRLIIRMEWLGTGIGDYSEVIAVMSNFFFYEK